MSTGKREAEIDNTFRDSDIVNGRRKDLIEKNTQAAVKKSDGVAIVNKRFFKTDEVMIDFVIIFFSRFITVSRENVHTQKIL